MERSERIEMLDRLIMVLRRNPKRRYLSIQKLKEQIPPLRIWSDAELQTDLDFLADGTYHTLNVVKSKTKGGVTCYRFNSHFNTYLKDAKAISYALKSDEERREIDKSEFEYLALKRSVKIYVDPRFWVGVIAGAITVGISLIGIYIQYLQSK